MKQKYPLRGVVVSLNTPFTASGNIDFDSLARAVEMHLQEGAVRFLSPAQAADQMIEALDRGVDVYMPTTMTRFYDLIVRNHAAGRREIARL